MLKRLYYDALKRHNRTLYTRKGKFNISYEWLCKQDEIQNGKCYYSGKEYSKIAGNYDSVSIERINDDYTYTRENARLILRCLNAGQRRTWNAQLFQDFRVGKYPLIEPPTMCDILDKCNWCGKVSEYKYCNTTCQSKGLTSSTDGFIKYMIRACRSSTVKRNSRKRKFGTDVLTMELSSTHILECLKKQRYKCAISNAPLTMFRVENNPYQASIDRLDNTKGYTLGNIRLVCCIFNTSVSWDRTIYKKIFTE